MKKLRQSIECVGPRQQIRGSCKHVDAIVYNRLVLSGRIFSLTLYGLFGTSICTPDRRISAPSPSGKAEVCNTFISSSNLLGASNNSKVPAVNGWHFFFVRPAGRVVRKHHPFGCGDQMVTWR